MLAIGTKIQDRGDRDNLPRTGEVVEHIDPVYTPSGWLACDARVRIKWSDGTDGLYYPAGLHGRYNIG